MSFAPTVLQANEVERPVDTIAQLRARQVVELADELQVLLPCQQFIESERLRGHADPAAHSWVRRRIGLANADGALVWCE